MLKKIYYLVSNEGFLGFLEFFISYLRGKGYGSHSVRREIRAIKTFLDPNQVRLCIDAGGNVGNYSAELKLQFPHSAIHVFEPQKKNIKLLESRFNLEQNIFIVPKGLSDESMSATLYTDEPGSGLGSLSKRDLRHLDIEFGCEEEISIVKFSDYAEQHLHNKQIDLFKLDIEGHELSALKGCGDFLDNIKVIQFEFGGCNIDTRTYFKDFWSLLSSKGFKFYRITPFGIFLIPDYREADECFITTNYLAVSVKC
jgi:FkbM family methyltransferase